MDITAGLVKLAGCYRGLGGCYRRLGEACWMLQKARYSLLDVVEVTN